MSRAMVTVWVLLALWMGVFLMSVTPEWRIFQKLISAFGKGGYLTFVGIRLAGN